MKDEIVPRLVMIATFMFASAVCGATYSIKSDLDGKTVDLTDPATYLENAVPSGEGDVITVSAVWPYMTVTVSGPESMALLADIERLEIGYGNEFILDCEGDFTLPAQVKGNGTFVKEGAGTVRFASHKIDSNGLYYDYSVNIDVREGVLRMVQADDATMHTHSHYAVNVEAGATLVTVLNGTTQVKSLSGAGLVTNECTDVNEKGDLIYNHLNISNTGPDAGFDGIVAGQIMVRPTGGFLTLRNPANTFTGGVQLNKYRNNAPFGGILQVTKFANADEPSSLGMGASTMISVSSGGGLVRYIGNERSCTDRSVMIPDWPVVLDAGHYGGITFNGLFATYGNTVTLNELQLTGSNSVPCDIYGEIRTYLKDGLYRPFYIVKHGTGTWRIFDRIKSGKAQTIGHQNAPRGVIGVEDGTLEFDSLANAGEYCALGFSMDLYRRGATSPNDADRVEYAWLLGGVTDEGAVTEGRMLYTGSENVQVTNRPMALASSGAFGTTEARVRLFDVRPEGDGAKTLALEAPAGITNDLCDVAGTGSSPIGIVKRGGGTWRIGGNVSLGGPIAVEGGELVVENRPKDSAYTWFRITFKQTAATCPRYKDFPRPDGVVTNFNSSDLYLTLAEFALFDESGDRINLGITQSSGAVDIAGGQSHVGPYAKNAVTFNSLTANTECLFDNRKPTSDGGYYGGMRFYTKTQMSLDDPDTWVPVVFRLTNGAPRAVACDFVYPCSISNDVSGAQRMPTAMHLDASNDGVHWERVWEDNELEIPNGNENEYKWASNGDGWWAGYHTARTVSSGKAFPLSRTGQLRETSCLTEIPKLSVAAGASFRIESDSGVAVPVVWAIEVDGAAGAGAVSGVAFAESGVLDVTGLALEGRSVTVPLGFAGVEGAGNLCNWTFTVDGETPSRNIVTVSPDGAALTVSRIGMTIVIR